MQKLARENGISASRFILNIVTYLGVGGTMFFFCIREGILLVNC